MRCLLESGVWLLVPGPKEEERGTEGVVASILSIGVILFNAFYLGSAFSRFGEFADLTTALFLAAVGVCILPAGE